MSKEDDKKVSRHGLALLNPETGDAYVLCDHPGDERCGHLDEPGETVYESSDYGGKSSVGWSRAYDSNWERAFGSSGKSMPN